MPHPREPRIRRGELPRFLRAARQQKTLWYPNDGRPIIGVNEGRDKHTKPYVVLRNITCVHPLLDDAIIEAGFTTDLGSIPWLLKIIPGFRPTDPGTRAFLRHDYEYARQWALRKLIDVVMEQDLIADGMAAWKAKLCYWGVRLGGKRAWEQHRRRIEEHEK